MGEMLWGEIYTRRKDGFPMSLLFWRRQDVAEALLARGQGMLPVDADLEWLMVAPARAKRLHAAEESAIVKGGMTSDAAARVDITMHEHAAGLLLSAWWIVVRFSQPAGFICEPPHSGIRFAPALIYLQDHLRPTRGCPLQVWASGQGQVCLSASRCMCEAPLKRLQAL